MKTPILAALAALALTSAASAATVPDCFSPEAKARLANAIDLVDNAHCVNVIYFIGSDGAPVADYERRLSELLIYIRQFYGQEMARNGFGNRSFGLALKPDGLVDMILIRGKEPAERYGYSNGGWPRCMEEINAWFAEHPDKKLSEHNFVIMPTLYNDEYNDRQPGGVPFYGVGKNCFALDYKFFDIKHLGGGEPFGWLMTKWYGGFAHELGHGLNLPHNNGCATDNASYGTPLMNCGNSTFGIAPTYLTKASCAILDRAQIFAPAGDETEFYSKEDGDARVATAKLECKDNEFTVTLRVEGPCVHANIYIQDPPYAVNQDYDAVAFTADMSDPAEDGSREVKLTIPRDELASLKADDAQIIVILVQQDGNLYRWTTEMKWSELEKGAKDVTDAGQTECTR